MSWTPMRDPYVEFELGPTDPWQNPRYLRPWDMSLDVWELTNSHPQGVWHFGIPEVSSLAVDPDLFSLRIIFAPLDLPSNAAICVPLFKALDIPEVFTTERIQGVAHSFGNFQDSDGSSCAWFHFLCKHLEIDRSATTPRVVNHVKNPYGTETVNLSQADFSWLRSGFFQRTGLQSKNTTLVCFGATPRVRERLEMWIESGLWHMVADEPRVLLDLVIAGLHIEVDTMVWRAGQIFGPMEMAVLKSGRLGFPAFDQQVDFVGMHNILKHIIFLMEAIESCKLIIEGIRSMSSTSANSSNTTTPTFLTSLNTRENTTTARLHASLSHWKSLFKSTSLRLSSLHRRAENAINLCFNLVSQQDSMMMRHESMTMRQDASAMKVLASINVVFLPTMAVASVIGSELFQAQPREGDEGRLDVQTSPLFNILWMISAPMTLCVIIMAAIWSWYTHLTYPKTSEEMRQRLDNNQKFLPRWVLTLRKAAGKLGIAKQDVTKLGV